MKQSESPIDMPAGGPDYAKKPARPQGPSGTVWHPPAWLPGRWRLVEGRPSDYKQVARWHYRAGPPATWCRVAAIRHERPGVPGDVVAALAVLSWPTICNRGRTLAFDLKGISYRERMRWGNEHVRTISRVIVRPGYRGAGLAMAVVRELVRTCPSPFVESTAAMGAFHPMFERCGFRRVEVPGHAPYFWRSSASTSGSVSA
ncbi:MAG: hypothetical protein AAGI46_06550 [Planctomycetota bacterium]